MGEARRRGNKEDRVQQAIERETQRIKAQMRQRAKDHMTDYRLNSLIIDEYSNGELK